MSLARGGNSLNLLKNAVNAINGLDDEALVDFYQDEFYQLNYRLGRKLGDALANLYQFFDCARRSHYADSSGKPVSADDMVSNLESRFRDSSSSIRGDDLRQFGIRLSYLASNISSGKYGNCILTVLIPLEAYLQGDAGFMRESLALEKQLQDVRKSIFNQDAIDKENSLSFVRTKLRREWGRYLEQLMETIKKESGPGAFSSVKKQDQGEFLLYDKQKGLSLFAAPAQQAFEDRLAELRETLDSKGSPLALAVQKYDEASTLNQVLCRESSTHEAALMSFGEQYKQKRDVLNYPRDGWLMQIIKLIADALSFKQFSAKIYRTNSHRFTEMVDSAIDHLSQEQDLALSP